ncbi:phytanoyl-CoA dioxygenase family protein [Methyloterricola oryzae]|uniref:phytanoyl-CoA dioxygenase family protein n=1 Tax=Methyloterricola oryzae TaxID=1495050 RepID=UPI0005EBCAE3|nr:phytanoyl-CoA dioxygenase family protein [Methyloterricola oryzae]
MSEKSEFEDQGYLGARSLLSPPEIGHLTKIVDRIYRQWLEENRAAYIENKLINLHSLTSPKYFQGHEAERLSLFQLLASDRLFSLLDRLFGDELYFHNTQLFFNPFKSDQSPYWHRDLQYTPIDDAAQAAEQLNLLALHVRIPLVPEQGLELIPGTHKRWDTDLERNVRLELNGHHNGEELPGAVLLELDPGDVLIFHAQMIHRGNYRLNETRKALDLCIGRPHPYTLPYLDKDTLPSAYEQDRIDNARWYQTARAIARTSAPEGCTHP